MITVPVVSSEAEMSSCTVKSLVLLVILLSCQLLLVAIAAGSGNGERGEEEFAEELLLKPLPDRKVLAHFHFESRAPPSSSNGRHHHLFPKAISQLVKKFHVKELELSFTQGRWNYELWGGFDPLSSIDAKPVGVELWAVFDVPDSETDSSWKNLTHALSGLFCASINFLEASTSYTAPKWGFRPDLDKLRYGTLPREAVCTENLTPWLNLLPCRDKAGLSTLMDRPSIFRGFYHSQRLHLVTTRSVVEGLDSGIVLEQTLTVVLHPKSQKVGIKNTGEKSVQPSWSLDSVFGRKVDGRCPLSATSNVYLQIDSVPLADLKNLKEEKEVTGDASAGQKKGLWSPEFELSVKPDKVLEVADSLSQKAPSILFQFPIDHHGVAEPFDLGLTWKAPVTWSSQQAPLHASRFLMGSGNERGAIAISLKSTKPSGAVMSGNRINGKCTVRVNVFQVFPWYVKVYYHTLRVFVDEQPMALDDVIENMHVSPSTDKVSPGFMEMALKLSCSMKLTVLTLEFDKGFLHIDEYPPDANQGFDIPSAVISFPDHHASWAFKEETSLKKSPLLSKFKEKSLLRSYTEILLVPLTTPDFSMPYNVITITCTVFALYFGSLLNVLRRRVSEEERLLKDGKKSGPIPRLLSKISGKLRGKPADPAHSSSASSPILSSKLLLKVILVAAIAVGWQYFST